MDNFQVENSLHTPSKTIAPGRKSGSTDFGGVIKEAIQNVKTAEEEADGSIAELLSGKGDIPSTMLAIQKADISVKLILAIRNKVIEAYREIIHMHF